MFCKYIYLLSRCPKHILASTTEERTNFYWRKNLPLIIILSTIILLPMFIMFYNLLQFIYQPQFIGYYSDVFSIKIANFSQIKLNAKLNDYDISQAMESGSTEYIKGSNQAFGSYLQLEYCSSYDNSAYTSLDYQWYANDTNAEKWLWELLTDSLNLSVEKLEQVKTYAYSTYKIDNGKARLKCNFYGAKPYWEKASKYLGFVKKTDKYRLGIIQKTYDSGLIMQVNYPHLYITNSVSKGVFIKMYVDVDLDFQIIISTNNKLDNYMNVFSDMCEKLGLSLLDINKIELFENYVYR